MSQPQVLRTLRALIAIRGATRVLVTSSLCRLSYAMIGLSMMLTIEHATGSLRSAATSSASFSILALTTPWKARWVDRRGARVPIALLGCAFSASLFATAILALSGVHGAPLFVATSAISGVVSPPIGPSVRSLWAHVSNEVVSLTHLYSFDLVLEDSLFTLGPVVVGLVVACNGPLPTLFISAALMCIGSLGLALASIAGFRSNRSSSDGPRVSRSTLLSPGFVTLLLIVAALSSMYGVVEVAVVARALAGGVPAQAGYLLAVITFGGIIGGPLWTRQRWLTSSHGELGFLALVVATSAVGYASLRGLAPRCVTLFILGVAMTPVLIVSLVTVTRICAAHARAESGAWVSTAFNAGVALGTFVAGIASTHHLVVAALNGDALIALVVGSALLTRTALARHGRAISDDSDLGA